MRLWKLNCGCIAVKDEEGDFVVIKPCHGMDMILSNVYKEAAGNPSPQLLSPQEQLDAVSDVRREIGRGKEALKRLREMVETIDWIRGIK